MRKNSDLAESIRRTAYFFWEQDGAPEGRALQYWLKAKEMHIRHRAYDRWLAEGTPVGRAGDNWGEALEDLGE